MCRKVGKVSEEESFLLSESVNGVHENEVAGHGGKPGDGLRSDGAEL